LFFNYIPKKCQKSLHPNVDVIVLTSMHAWVQGHPYIHPDFRHSKRFLIYFVMTEIVTSTTFLVGKSKNAVSELERQQVAFLATTVIVNMIKTRVGLQGLKFSLYQ
jgi:hypothetical protein